MAPTDGQGASAGRGRRGRGGARDWKQHAQVVGCLAGVLGALLAAVPLIWGGGAWFGRGAFEVVELSADGSQVVGGQATDPLQGAAQDVEVHATVLTVVLKNDSDDLKVFERITVETEDFVPVTDCVDGVGGPVGVTGSYEVDLPAVGEESSTDIAYALEPKKAEALELPVGGNDLGGGVALIRVTLHESGGDAEEVGSIAVLTVPGTWNLYPRPLHRLDIAQMPSPRCVHETHDGLLALIEDAPEVADNVRTLTENVGETSRRLGG